MPIEKLCMSTRFVKNAISGQVKKIMNKIYPIYLNKKSPCYSVDQLGNKGCPAHSDIARFVYSINIGEHAQAFNILKETNPFSGGCGRFCDHPCETACNRAKFDGAVDIKYLERFASDYGYENNIMGEPVKERKGKSVGIIGSGPAGLACAYFLARNGYDTVVYERHQEAGGILREGIPSFRYPKEIREYELKYIESFGVEIKCGSLVDGDFLMKLIEEHDGVIVATGAQKPRKMGISGDELPEVKVGFEFLRDLSFDPDFVKGNYKGILDKLGLGQEVAIIGGGYTAFDVARSVVRLGGSPSVFYRRGMDEMTAHPGEVEEAQEEGVRFDFLTAPTEIKKGSDGRLEMVLQKMRLGEPDESGRRRPLPIEGSQYSVQVDNVVTAIGETPELDFIPGDFKIDGFRLIIEKLSQEQKSKVFISGDALQESSSATGMVVRAVGLAQETCVELRNFLGESVEKVNYEENIAYYDSIKTRYFPVESRVRIDKLSFDDRKGNFKEVDLALSVELAMTKAGRCWNCGICIQCDWCRDYSNQAILKLSVPWNPVKTSHFYKFIKEKVDFSTRDSVSGCPRNAMALVPGDETWKGQIDKQYISIESIKY
ncbi:MAG: FAD-dependent oxidoreductase [Spirochaetota bacterium]|nr:FAD-dependent oxidoreductase [Spirochaetota bacterium]